MTAAHRRMALLAAVVTAGAASVLASAVLLGRFLSRDVTSFAANRLRVLANPLVRLAGEAFPEYAPTDAAVADLLQRLRAMDATLLVVDLDGAVLLDSEHPDVPGAPADAPPARVEIWSYVHPDAAFESAHPGIVRVAFPVTVHGRQAANAVLQLPRTLASTAARSAPPALLYAPGIAGLLLVLLALTGGGLWFERRVLAPLRLATVNVSRYAVGDLAAATAIRGTPELRELGVAIDRLRTLLADTIAHAERQEQLRKELVAHVSHDLRTPLASIRVYLEGIREGIARDPAAVERYLSVIARNTDTLARLVDDLFQHSLLNLEKLAVTPTEQYTAPVLEAILEPLRLRFAKDRVRFVVEEPLPNVLARIDPLRLEQVIANLVENARRNTPDGGSITVRSLLADELLAVSIEDSGRGIAPDELGRVFEPFFRGTTGAPPREAGSGLGLAICKYIVEKHGGRIWADTPPGGGACFTFTIPTV